jgi:hypothetical protein
VIALTIVVVIVFVTSGCKRGPDPDEVLDGAVGRVENAADFVEDALEDWSDSIGDSQATFESVAEASSEITPAVRSATDAVSRAEESVEPLERSEAKTRFLEGTRALSDLLDRMSETLEGITETSELARAFSDLATEDEAAWENYTAFISQLNGEEWDEALATAERARDEWVRLRDRASELDEAWPDRGFDQVQAMMQRQVDLSSEMTEQAELGAELDRYSSSSVDAYNDQLDIMDSVKDEILEWNLPAPYENPWSLYDDFDDDFDEMDERHRAFRGAMDDVRELLR